MSNDKYPCHFATCRAKRSCLSQMARLLRPRINMYQKCRKLKIAIQIAHTMSTQTSMMSQSLRKMKSREMRSSNSAV